MDLTRTQFGLIALLVSAVLALVTLTISLLNPEAAMGMAAGGQGGFSATLIAVSCLGGLSIIANIAGLATLLSGARNYSRAHWLACLVALVVFVLSIGVPIAANLGGGNFARTGDEAAYARTLWFSMITALLSAAALPLATWFLFKPNWRALPVVVGIGRAVAGVGQIQATLAHSSLEARTFGDQTLYMPHFDVPLDSGPIFYWQVAGWAVAVLLAGMFAVLLFAPDDAMRPRPEKKPTLPPPES